MTEIRVERAQAQLVIVSNETSSGLRETDHVAGFEPLIAEKHSQANTVLCGVVVRDVQLVAFSCYCSPAIVNEVETHLEGLDLGSNQRAFFRFPDPEQLPYASRPVLV